MSLLKTLKSNIETLDKNERSLDEQIKFMQLNKKIMLQDESNARNNFISYADVCKIYPDAAAQTLLLVKTNPDTLIEVPEPMYVSVKSMANV